MYVARNKNGELYLHIIKPFRDKEEWDICGYEDNCKYFMTPKYLRHTSVYLPDELFPQFNNIKWEDEPLEVDLKIKNPEQ